MLKELYEYFVQKYFTVDTSSLENISFNGTGISFSMIFIGLFIGIIVAAFSAIYNKRILGDAVRNIINSKCADEKSAKTLSELGYGRNTFVRSALKYGSAMRKYVLCVEDEKRIAELKEDGKEIPYNFKTDLDSAHFYIPEENRIKADIRYEKKGTSWFAFFGILIGGTVFLVLFIKVFPDLLKLVDNFLSLTKK